MRKNDVADSAVRTAFNGNKFLYHFMKLEAFGRNITLIFTTQLESGAELLR